MQMAIQEAGLPRILLAAAISAVGKAIGQRGWFYELRPQRERHRWTGAKVVYTGND